MTELISEENIQKPPFFKKWRFLYLFIVGWLFLLIMAFNAFSNAY